MNESLNGLPSGTHRFERNNACTFNMDFTDKIANTAYPNLAGPLTLRTQLQNRFSCCDNTRALFEA